MEPVLKPLPPQSHAAAQPGVILWFKSYCWVLCFLYLLVSAASLMFFLGDPEELEMSRSGAIAMGVIFLVMGLGLFVLSALPLVVRPKPWVWTFDLIVICIGMTSACFVPLCIPLLIFWLKPETKAWFARE